MDAGLKLALPLLPSMKPDPAERNDTTARTDPAKTREAAEQFEALLIGQMLRTAREASGAGGWLGTEEEAGQTYGELAEQQVAQALAARGGFGLADLIWKGLENQAQRGTGESRAPAPGAASD